MLKSLWNRQGGINDKFLLTWSWQWGCIYIAIAFGIFSSARPWPCFVLFVFVELVTLFLFVCVLFLLLSSLLRPVCYLNFSLLVSFAGWLDYSSSFACFLARLPACLLAWLLACLPACLHSMFVLRCMFVWSLGNSCTCCARCACFCVLRCLLVCLFLSSLRLVFVYALRVLPAETRLTVYRRRQFGIGWALVARMLGAKHSPIFRTCCEALSCIFVL